LAYLHEIGTRGGEQRSAKKADAVRENVLKANAARKLYRLDPSQRPKKKKK
jgi:hypothetical protein